MSRHLFEAYGIELEYMIVDTRSLNVQPISDVVLIDEDGEPTSDVERDEIAWSNELTHHVIELKTNGPADSLIGLSEKFQENVWEINRQLRAHHARLLPTAMHPWMDPAKEMQLWPHDYNVVYETFHKIFDCRGHGWANLQSMHINLPFANDEEFGKLHAAIRLLLPLLPGIAASSPFIAGVETGMKDSRLDVYRKNSKGVASVSGRVIPEQVYDFESYDRGIFQVLARDIAPLDPQGVLQPEFLNSRGAIGRFSRGAIEIRVIDVQECPKADLAIAALTVEVLKLLVDEVWASTQQQQNVTIDELEPVLLAAIENGERAIITNRNVLRHFGSSRTAMTLSELWQHLYQVAWQKNAAFKAEFGETLEVIFSQGTLATRMLNAVGENPNPRQLRDLYQRLADCLEHGSLFQVQAAQPKQALPA